MTFPLGSRTAFTEGLIDTISKEIRIFPVEYYDQLHEWETVSEYEQQIEDLTEELL